MIYWRMPAKVFAFFYLFFASLIPTAAQKTGTADEASIYNLPEGTKILVQMDNEINSRVSSVDDTFTTTTTEPVVVRDTVVVPIGTVIEGRVLKVSSAAPGGKDGRLEVRFEMMRFAAGERRDIDAVLVNELEAPSSIRKRVITILGGAALGGILGAAANSDRGALIGTGIGAGIGTGTAILLKGKDVRIRSDEVFEIRLTREVVLPVRDY